MPNNLETKLETTQETRVCVLHLSHRVNTGAGLKWMYHTYKSPAVASLFAHRFVEQMRSEGFDTIMRGVFIEEGKNWKTIGSYFDV